MRVLVEGICRGKVKKFAKDGDTMAAAVTVLHDEVRAEPQLEALIRNVLATFNDYVHLNRRVPDEILATANNIANPLLLSYTIASHLILKVGVKQEILEQDDLVERFRLLSRTLASELEILKLERKIEGQVRSQVHKNQKEFYLNEQLKAIRKELGYQNEFSNEIEELTQQVKKARMPKDVNDKAMKELDKLQKMSFMSPEATVVRNYIDWLVSLPWSVATDDNVDIKEVERILDEDHYGLKKVKERIVEYIAVLKLSGKLKGPILCFVGPPGVGKTSLGKSIARALGRKFVRMSLGGVRDEAEIRGHRRTYIGSLPGRIIQGMKRAGTKNPVFLLDEIDKLGMDFRGDPASALLEVLDPSRTSPSRITTSRPTSTSRRSCSSRPRTPVFDPGTSRGSHGDHPAPGLSRAREGRDREEVPDSQRVPRARARAVGSPDRRQGVERDHQPVHARGWASGVWSARSRPSAARSRARRPRSTSRVRSTSRSRACTSTSACRSTSTARSSVGLVSVWRPVSRGPTPAAMC
jgi:DNA replication protein DnaC